MKPLALLSGRRATSDAGPAWDPEIVTVHPRRTAVPHQAWRDLFTGARREIGVLVYAGAFLARDDDLMRVLAQQASFGVRVRILLGDPGGTAVARRGDDEGIAGGMADLVRSSLERYRTLLAPSGAQVRLHDTVLYNSLYLADGELLVNQHVLGVGAADAPVTHLRRRVDGRLFRLHRDSFERVWSESVPTR